MGLKCADVKGCFSRLTGVCKRTVRCFETGVLYLFKFKLYICGCFERARNREFGWNVQFWGAICKIQERGMR